MLFLQAAFLRSRFCYIRCNPISDYFIQSAMTRGRFHSVVKVIEHLDAPVSSVLFIAQGCGAEKIKILPTTIHPCSMARKKKQDDLRPAPIEPSTVDPGRQPRVLGWLVLIVGTASTWYWYRPLPPSVTEAVNATQSYDWSNSPSEPKSIWTDQGLIVPSLSDSNKAPTFDPTIPNREVPELVGTTGIALVPWHEPKSNLRDVLQTERLPMEPIEPLRPEANSPTKDSTTWIPENVPAKTKGTTKIPENTNAWPDEGYVSDSAKQRADLRAATKITTQIPPLLETGMRSIRTEEAAQEGNVERKSLADKASKSISDAATGHATSATRPPNFIRQPKK